MFDFSDSPFAVPEDLTDLFISTWDDIASPGSGWSGVEKVALAGRARSVRTGNPARNDAKLPPATEVAIELLVREPSHADEEWVRGVISEIGQARYIELVGVVAAVTGIDVMTGFLLGREEALPNPRSGDPVPRLEPRARRRKAWVSMAGPPLPRNALSAVPASQLTANRLLQRLYMNAEEHRDPGPVRGLARAQVELVATVVSHANRCFYCTLGHLIALRARAADQGLTVDHRAIVDQGVDSGIEGGRELIDLAVEATKPSPDSAALARLRNAIGSRAAMTALEVAVSFVMTNRIIEATGQPVLVNQRNHMLPLLKEIGADVFPHSGLTTERDKPGILTRIGRKMAGSRRRRMRRR